MVIDACLVDTNVLLRIPRRSEPNHPAVDNALAKLAIQGTILFDTHENIAELWNPMTRPQLRNRFGLSVQDNKVRVRHPPEIGVSTLPSYLYCALPNSS
jgi:hypothetical protein